MLHTGLYDQVLNKKLVKRKILICMDNPFNRLIYWVIS